jgi:diguanylate cyclase (GGDEF)-like protein
MAEISGIPVDLMLTQGNQEFDLPDSERFDGDEENARRYYRIQGFPLRKGIVKANGRSFLITDMTSYKVRENSLAIIANHDALTQVYNRRFFFDYFGQLQNRHFGIDISILMIDADHFKDINDTYGHLAGDEVLKTIAQRILGCLRTSDIISRFGGEEFIVLLSGTPSAGMEIVASRILLAISDNPFVFEMTRTARGLMAMEEMNINMTVSIGA